MKISPHPVQHVHTPPTLSKLVQRGHSQNTSTTRFCCFYTLAKNFMKSRIMLKFWKLPLTCSPKPAPTLFWPIYHYWPLLSKSFWTFLNSITFYYLNAIAQSNPTKGIKIAASLLLFKCWLYTSLISQFITLVLSHYRHFGEWYLIYFLLWFIIL